jgi:hypothetical protein
MSNSKISALTSATTPLAGTETLPIVQSSATTKVTVANLTAGRAVSAASLALTTTPLPVTSGGTGIATLTAGYIPYGAGTSAFASSANLFWDSANSRLGIGTASPTTKVQITRNALTGFLSRTSAALTLEDTAGTELYFASSTTGYNQLRFGDTDSNFRGAITYDHNVDAMYFYTAGTERVRIDLAGNFYISTASLWQYAPTPTTKAAAATLTAAELSTDIITLTGISYTITLPTGSALDTYYTGVATTNIGYDFHIINNASGIITIAVGATGMTSVGLLTVAATVSAHFRLRRTAANTYVLYRLS